MCIHSSSSGSGSSMHEGSMHSNPRTVTVRALWVRIPSGPSNAPASSAASTFARAHAGCCQRRESLRRCSVPLVAPARAARGDARPY